MDEAHSTFEGLLQSATTDFPDTDALQGSVAADPAIAGAFSDSDDLPDDDTVQVSSFGTFLIKVGINMVLPFINGVMLGCGEIFAHEVGFKWGWGGARVYPARRMTASQDTDDKSVLKPE